MPPHRVCLSLAELATLLDPRVPPHLLRVGELHLVNCASCRQRLADLSSAPTISTSWRDFMTLAETRDGRDDLRISDSDRAFLAMLANHPPPLEPLEPPGDRPQLGMLPNGEPSNMDLPDSGRADSGQADFGRADRQCSEYETTTNARRMEDEAPDGGVDNVGDTEDTDDTDHSEYSAPRIPGLKLLGIVGRGGMGVVYGGYDAALRRRVACKVLPGPFPSVVERARFQREAEAIARLDHPDIVRVFYTGEVNRTLFIAMEFLAGISLRDYLRGRPQPPREAAMFAVRVAEAVEHAHSKGVFHRDLKPANIMLILDGGSLESPDLGDAYAQLPLSRFAPKILDFGLAKIAEPSPSDPWTLTGQLLGTPCFAAPEQLAGGKTTSHPAADVYSVGAILYQLLTGMPPFPADDLARLLERIRDQEPVSPRLLRPAIPADLETICLKCLSKAPAQRYQSMRELGHDLGRFLRGEPIVARPASIGQTLLRAGQRYPGRSAALALAPIACLLCLTVAWHFQEAARVERKLRAHQAELNSTLSKVSQAESSWHRQWRAAAFDRALETGMDAESLAIGAKMLADATADERREIRTRMASILNVMPILEGRYRLPTREETAREAGRTDEYVLPGKPELIGQPRRLFGAHDGQLFIEELAVGRVWKLPLTMDRLSHQSIVNRPMSADRRWRLKADANNAPTLIDLTGQRPALPLVGPAHRVDAWLRLWVSRTERHIAAQARRGDAHFLYLWRLADGAPRLVGGPLRLESPNADVDFFADYCLLSMERQTQLMTCGVDGWQVIRSWTSTGPARLDARHGGYVVVAGPASCLDFLASSPRAAASVPPASDNRPSRPNERSPATTPEPVQPVRIDKDPHRRDRSWLEQLSAADVGRLGTHHVLGYVNGEVRFLSDTAEGVVAHPFRIAVGAAPIRHLRRSPDGRWVLAIDEAGVWAVLDGRLPQLATPRITTRRPVVDALWFADSQRLATLDGDGLVSVWRLSGAMLAPGAGHSEDRAGLRHANAAFPLLGFVDSGRSVIAIRRQSLEVWSGDEGRRLAISKLPFAPRFAAFARDGDTVVITGGGPPDGPQHQAACFSRSRGEFRSAASLPSLTANANQAIAAAGDAWLVWDSRRLHLLGLPDFTLLASIAPLASRGDLVDAEILASGEVAYTTTGGWLVVWDRLTGAEVRAWQHDSPQSTQRIAVRPGGSELFAFGQAGLHGWRRETGEPIASLPRNLRQHALTSFHFDQDGRHALAVYRNSFAQVWNTLDWTPAGPAIDVGEAVADAQFTVTPGVIAVRRRRADVRLAISNLGTLRGSPTSLWLCPLGLWDWRSGRPLASPNSANLVRGRAFTFPSVPYLVGFGGDLRLRFLPWPCAPSWSDEELQFLAAQYSHASFPSDSSLRSVVNVEHVAGLASQPHDPSDDNTPAPFQPQTAEELVNGWNVLQMLRSAQSPKATTKASAHPSDLPPLDLPPLDLPPSDLPPSDSPPSDLPPLDSPPSDLPPLDSQSADRPPSTTPLTGIAMPASR